MSSELEQVEAYLDRVCAQLPATTDAARDVVQRDAIRREVRAHLEAMMNAERIDGRDAATALASALRRFGDAENVGRALAREWTSKRGLSGRVVVSANGRALYRRDVAITGRRRTVGLFGSAVWMLGMMSFYSGFDGPFPLTMWRMALLWSIGLSVAGASWLLMERVFPRFQTLDAPLEDVCAATEAEAQWDRPKWARVLLSGGVPIQACALLYVFGLFVGGQDFLAQHIGWWHGMLALGTVNALCLLAAWPRRIMGYPPRQHRLNAFGTLGVMLVFLSFPMPQGTLKRDLPYAALVVMMGGLVLMLAHKQNRTLKMGESLLFGGLVGGGMGVISTLHLLMTQFGWLALNR